MEVNRKMPTEKDMIEQLRTGKVSLPPLTFRFLKGGLQGGGNLRFDAAIEASWGKKRAKFAVECKSLSTPKAFQDGLNMLKTSPLPKGWNPLLFVPFLSGRQLEELEREKISGLDLCGNGVVVVPEVFAVLRTGEKSRFVSSAPIKNIYRKNSSMVGRVFLVRPGFETVQDVCAEINLRNMLVKSGDKRPMTLPTVSKALKTLEEDLIIARGETIRLLQPDSLLEKLRDNYVQPNIKERIRLKIPGEAGAIAKLLLKKSQVLGLPLVASGTSSVGKYAVMQRADLLSVYCPRPEILLERVSGNPTDRFPNLEIIVTEDETIYFDARRGEDFWWASPMQVYLELMAGDKRDMETAEQVRSVLLRDLKAMR
jgi:hypothetical protein